MGRVSKSKNPNISLRTDKDKKDFLAKATQGEPTPLTMAVAVLVSQRGKRIPIYSQFDWGDGWGESAIREFVADWNQHTKFGSRLIPMVVKIDLENIENNCINMKGGDW